MKPCTSCGCRAIGAKYNGKCTVCYVSDLATRAVVDSTHTRAMFPGRYHLWGRTGSLVIAMERPDGYDLIAPEYLPATSDAALLHVVYVLAQRAHILPTPA